MAKVILSRKQVGTLLAGTLHNITALDKGTTICFGEGKLYKDGKTFVYRNAQRTPLIAHLNQKNMRYNLIDEEVYVSQPPYNGKYLLVGTFGRNTVIQMPDKSQRRVLTENTRSV